MDGEVNMEQVMKKLANLKNLADRPGTPEEAAAALMQIQRIMAKYRISQAELEAAGETEVARTIHDKMEANSATWSQTLLVTIARSNGCRVLGDRSSGAMKFHIFGREQGVAATIAMYQYLVKTIDHLATIAWEENPSPWETARSFKHSFRVGASITVGKRITEQAKGAYQGLAKGTEIVSVDLADAKRLMNDMFGPTQSRRITMNSSSSLGMAFGKQAGEGINLDSQVSSGKGHTKALKG